MDEHNNRILLKQAILDGMSQKYEEEMALNEETADCSKQHYVKMRRILNSHGTNVINMKFNKRALIAILIAAALLLAGCSVYVFHEAISDFIVEIYDDHINIFHEERNNDIKPIESFYSLKYIPEGYELKTDVCNSGMVYYVWENLSGERISFKQISLSGNDILLNVENVSTTTIESNQLKIYCRQFEDSCYYIWSEEIYCFTLFIRGTLAQDEVIRIIDNIDIK